MNRCPKCGYEPKKPSVSQDVINDIINHLNKRTGKEFRTKITSTNRLINARFNEGFTYKDFITVIDNMCREWLSDPQMQKFLRPQTLFGTKFDAYLQNGKKVAPQQAGQKYIPAVAMGQAYQYLSQYGTKDFHRYCNKLNMPKEDIDTVLMRYNSIRGKVNLFEAIS